MVRFRYTSLDALVRTMSAISANSAVFARQALAGAQVASKRSAVKAKAAFNVSANAKVDACDKNSVIVSPSILSANFATSARRYAPPPRAIAIGQPRACSSLPRARGEAIAVRSRRSPPAVRGRGRAPPRPLRSIDRIKPTRKTSRTGSRLGGHQRRGGRLFFFSRKNSPSRTRRPSPSRSSRLLTTSHPTCRRVRLLRSSPRTTHVPHTSPHERIIRSRLWTKRARSGSTST